MDLAAPRQVVMKNGNVAAFERRRCNHFRTDPCGVRVPSPPRVPHTGKKSRERHGAQCTNEERGRGSGGLRFIFTKRRKL